MKDNFDLKNYLVENKMTENSRGKGRHHFGETFISPKVLTEGFFNKKNKGKDLDKLTADDPIEALLNVCHMYSTDVDDDELKQFLLRNPRFASYVLHVDNGEEDFLGSLTSVYNNVQDAAEEFCKMHPEAASLITDKGTLFEQNPYDHHDPDYDEDYASKEGADTLDRYNDALRDEALNESNSSYPKAQEWLSQHPNVKIIRDLTSILDPEEDPDYVTTATEAGYAFISELEAILNNGKYDDEFIEGACESGVIDDPKFNPPASEFDYGPNSVTECGDVPTDFSGTVEEAGYTDDEDEWDDTDMSLANILRTDKKAAQAQKAAAKDIDPVDDSDLDAPVDDDAPVDEPDEAPAPKASNKWVSGDLSMDSLFGADAPNVDILDGDEDLSNDEALRQLFQKNKNYRPALLKRAVSQAMDYFREYEKPDVLYLMPAIDRGGYEMSRFNAGRRAVAAVYRPEDLSGQGWADQI